MLEITIGKDIAAYATIKMDEKSSIKDWKRAARQVFWNGHWDGQEIQFEPEWGDANNLRIVHVGAENGDTIEEDIPVETDWKPIADCLPPGRIPVLVAWENGLSPGEVAWNVYYNAVVYDEIGDQWLEYISLTLCDWKEEERPSHWRLFPRFN